MGSGMTTPLGAPTTLKKTNVKLLKSVDNRRGEDEKRHRKRDYRKDCECQYETAFIFFEFLGHMVHFHTNPDISQSFRSIPTQKNRNQKYKIKYF
jgi:hypothetical protein